MDRHIDRAAMALILSGALLAVLVAIFFPVLHVRAADRTLLGVSSWEAVPVVTLLKFLALAAAIAAHLMPQLRHLRLPLTVAAVVMLFVPALAALMAGVSPGTDARAILAQLSGHASPWVDPGWGILVLLVAGMLIGFGLWKERHLVGPGSLPI